MSISSSIFSVEDESSHWNSIPNLVGHPTPLGRLFLDPATHRSRGVMGPMFKRHVWNSWEFYDSIRKDSEVNIQLGKPMGEVRCTWISQINPWRRFVVREYSVTSRVKLPPLKRTARIWKRMVRRWWLFFWLGGQKPVLSSFHRRSCC